MINALRTLVSRFQQRTVAKNASWVLIGQGSNLLIQAACMVLLARLLDVTEYGVYAGAFAVVSIITPYSAIGSAMLFMRYVTADRSVARQYWGNTLLIITVVSALMAAVLALIGPALTKTPHALLFVLLVLANCLFGQIVTVSGAVFQTFESLHWTAILSVLSNLARLIVLIVLRLWIGHATAVQWAGGIIFASGAASCAALVLVHRTIGWPSINLRELRRRMLEGVGFSFAGSTQAVYNDVDKTMLSHYGFTRDNGIYSLAYRVIDVASAPTIAVDAAVLPRYFRLSQQGMGEVLRLAFRSVKTLLLINIGVAAILWIVAPILPLLAGRHFADAIDALRWLSLLPLLRGFHILTGSALTGTGYQSRRTIAQFSVAGANILLNMWLIPAHGWLGAAWASLASDGLLAIINTAALLWIWQRTRVSATAQVPEGVAL